MKMSINFLIQNFSFKNKHILNKVIISFVMFSYIGLETNALMNLQIKVKQFIMHSFKKIGKDDGLEYGSKFRRW